MTADADVAIVGAGPYGLSLAAHLQAAGTSFRIFGHPMSTWREQMPRGMFLKSDGFASNLSDPRSAFTLQHYCEQQAIPYDHTRIPVRLTTFSGYGLEFQKRMVPSLERANVTAISKTTNAFRLELDNGQAANARRVVLAIGISHFQHVPENLTHLPPELFSHSAAHHDVERFRGKSVTVLGGGASAVDLAAELHDHGAEVQVAARRPIRFGVPPAPGPRTIWQRIRRPASGIGASWQSRIYADAPGLFRCLPESLRLKIVKRHLGPSPAWFMKERVVGRIPLKEGFSLRAAEVRQGRVWLGFVDLEGRETELMTDHLIAATGYQVDLRRLRFLSAEIQSRLDSIQHTPRLSTMFESSVPGLYMIGVTSANCFGPVMRFAFGADYTARRLAKHLIGRKP